MVFFTRRQDSSIGFGAPVRANMRTGGLTNAVVTSSLLESVRKTNLQIYRNWNLELTHFLC